MYLFRELVDKMKSKYGGMTVNERLVMSGLSTSFDESINRQNYAKATEILEAVELDESNIKTILEHFSKKMR